MPATLRALLRCALLTAALLAASAGCDDDDDRGAGDDDALDTAPADLDETGADTAAADTDTDACCDEASCAAQGGECDAASCTCVPPPPRCATEGAACDAATLDSDDGTLTCVPYPAGATCRQRCATAATEPCPADFGCIEPGDPALAVDEPICHPEACAGFFDLACGAHASCLLVDPALPDFYRCAPNGGAERGASCDGPAACADTLACDEGGSSTCVEVECGIGPSDPRCPPGAACVIVSEVAGTGRCGAVCDPFDPGLGCSDQEACVGARWDATIARYQGVCWPFAGQPSQPGDPCDARETASCPGGLVCIADRCASACNPRVIAPGAAGGCPDGQRCATVGSSVEVGGCLDACNPWVDPEASGCATGEVCSVEFRESGSAVLRGVCLARATGALGDACGDEARCGTGLTCVNGGCQPFCDPLAPPQDSGCGEGSVCLGLLRPDGGAVDFGGCSCAVFEPGSCAGQTCSPIGRLDPEGPLLGLCQEAGELARDAMCLPQTEPYCETRLICAGSCAPACDPLTAAEGVHGCAPGEACIEGIGVTLATAICAESCALWVDPAQSGCAAGQWCTPSTWLRGAGHCRPAGSAGELEVCALDPDCAEGLVCVNGSCVRTCQVDSQPGGRGFTCGSSQTCSGLHQTTTQSCGTELDCGSDGTWFCENGQCNRALQFGVCL